MPNHAVEMHVQHLRICAGGLTENQMIFVSSKFKDSTSIVAIIAAKIYIPIPKVGLLHRILGLSKQQKFDAP